MHTKNVGYIITKSVAYDADKTTIKKKIIYNTDGTLINISHEFDLLQYRQVIILLE